MGYRISELASRSGFAASTLRYYETVGLLPDPERTDAGYRVYDDSALDRLAFISRAKAMGLALDDIAELVGLWADGPCAPVQRRLQDLLDDKAHEVKTQLADLTRFAAQLSHLRASLAADEPSDHCGPGCCCDQDLPDLVMLTERLAAPAAIACTLSEGERVERGSEWAGLLGLATDRRSSDTGLGVRLPADPEVVARAAELAVREVDCCSFFSFALTVGADEVWLEVSAPGEGRDLVDALFADRVG